MGLDLEYIGGQTPLDEDQKEGLLIQTIATRTELDEFEQKNIEEALQWVLTSSIQAEFILTEKFIRDLHKRMFGHVWSWAGNYRTSNKNLGVDKWQIQTELRKLCLDTLFWIEHSTYEPDVIAIRFKHRLVSIHCFPNGNGRHSRLMADIIIDKIFGANMFSWGTSNLSQQGDSRTFYLQAVKAADKNKFDLLISFARS